MAPQSPSATHAQIEALLNFMESHKDFARGLLRKAGEDRLFAKQLWETLTDELNALGGSTKTVEQWQRVWADRKHYVKKIAASIRTTPSATMKLTHNELKIVYLMAEQFGWPETEAKYWTEKYKASLKERAAVANSMEGRKTKSKPLSCQKRHWVELSDCAAAEGLPDSNLSVVQNSSTEANEPSMVTEWLDYESDGNQKEKETDESKSGETQSNSEHADLLQAEDTDDGDDAVSDDPASKESWKNLAEKSKKSTDSQPDGFSTNHIVKKSYQGRRRGRKTSIKKRPLHELTATAIEYFNSKKSKSTETQDPDLLFFHSILPEMKQMTAEQKRNFKMGVWTLATQILESNAPSNIEDG